MSNGGCPSDGAAIIGRLVLDITRTVGSANVTARDLLVSREEREKDGFQILEVRWKGDLVFRAVACGDSFLPLRYNPGPWADELAKAARAAESGRRYREELAERMKATNENLARLREVLRWCGVEDAARVEADYIAAMGHLNELRRQHQNAAFVWEDQ